MRRLAILAILIAVGGCAHVPRSTLQAIALDELLAFADPARCEAGPAQSKLLGAMVAGDDSVGFRVGRVEAPESYSKAFGPVYLQTHEHYTVIGVPVRGSLFGLPLAAIERSLPKGGDPGQTDYRFKAAPEVVERVLAARGFPVKLGRTVAVGPPEVYDHFIELIADRAHSGHVLLSCGYS